MKKIFTLFGFVLLSFTFFTCGPNESQSVSANGGAEVKWYNFNDGIKMAKKLKRPVVIDFYADWCRWCKVMEKETFGDTEVARRLKNEYIPIRIYTDRDHNEIINFKKHQLTKREFSAMLGVRGLPTLVFMDKDENLITKIPGFVKKDIFLPLLSYMKDECYKMNVSFDDYQNGKNNCAKK